MVDVPLLQSDTPLVFKISVASTDGRRATEAKATTEDLHMSASLLVYHRTLSRAVERRSSASRVEGLPQVPLLRFPADDSLETK
jgi:hypothetical protein